ncbi:MAG TPA: phospholipid-binding protein, partial [Polyangia bacterium]|nr:phospholipid-binding protein [Polyangia bacterium]
MKRLLGVAALVAGALALTKGVVVLADEPAPQPVAATGQVEPGGGTAVGDDAITNGVKRQLLADSELRRLDLAVTTNNGVVTLAG